MSFSLPQFVGLWRRRGIGVQYEWACKRGKEGDEGCEEGSKEYVKEPPHLGMIPDPSLGSVLTC